MKRPCLLVLVACALMLAPVGRASGAIAFGAVTDGSGAASAAATSPARDAAGKAAYTIRSVQWEQTPEEFVLRIRGDATPTYTMYELFDPLRVVIDIAEAAIDDGVSLPLDLPHGPVSLVNGKVLEDKKPAIVRLEIFLNDDNGYKIEREANDLVVRFAKVETTAAAEETPAAAPEETPAETAGAAAETAAAVPAAAPQQAAPVSSRPETVVSQETTAAPATILKEIKVDYLPGETRIMLLADGAIQTYKKAELAKNVKANRPPRMYVDLKGLKMSRAVRNVNIGTSVARVRTARRTDGIRVVFDSAADRLFSYRIEPTAAGLDVIVTEPSEEAGMVAGIIQQKQETAVVEPTQPAAEPETDMTAASAQAAPVAPVMTDVKTKVPVPAAAPAPDLAAPMPAAAEELAPALPSPAPAAAPAAPVKQAKKKKKKMTARQEFAFAGYDKQRITVDFFKIDLHNVFRLFGEISGKNIVVDDGVGGTLTLALNDVPWDFALDIILNLKDLQKEERFNTIVISPKSKKFIWPERSVDKIDIRENQQIIETEAISVRERLEKEPVRITEAKALLRRAQARERRGDYKGALAIYEQAYGKWRENSRIAHRIASLCLVHLGKNAKAVHYAKLALRQNPADTEAALQAAIGLANMKKTDDAKQYFDLAVSTPNPAGEALANYAAFLEQNNSLEAALSMLNRHEEIFGDTMETMVSKARVLDKLGRRDEAQAEYRAILLAGFNLPADLKRYIKGRVTMPAN